MQVDNCDRATYRCLVLNQVDFEEGSEQESLEIEASKWVHFLTIVRFYLRSEMG